MEFSFEYVVDVHCVQEITIFRKADKVRKVVQSSSTNKVCSPDTPTTTAAMAAKLSSPDVVPSTAPTPADLNSRSSPDGVASDSAAAPKH